MAEIDERYKDLLRSVGKAGAHYLFPNDIPYYALTLELVDSDGNTVDSLFFPVMPKEIRETESKLNNIKKTTGGISVLKTTTFIPKEISISGTFGRRFRILLGNGLLNFSAIRFSTAQGVFIKESMQNALELRKAVFDPTIKNGYGCLKILKGIIDKSDALDSKFKPHSLYLYNPSMGTNYQVEVINSTIEISEQDNMIHKYSVTFKAVAPLEQTPDFNRGKLIGSLGVDVVQKQINNIFSISRGLV